VRINRTFSIPVALAQELKKKHNQSETVTRALRKYLEPDDSEALGDAKIRTILFELRLRFEPMSAEMELLKTMIAIIS